ncbi:unnamed protein product [Rotaria sordida]|uniref:Uncharacterized protein n=1 Tax=Rotaria sordida TaxID=392033 RepID=A0A814F4Z3_9BILA|nr:unnamed protein product [Rotaria sordida]
MQLYHNLEWEHFIGISVVDIKETRSLPSWVNEERSYDVSAFKTSYGIDTKTVDEVHIISESISISSVPAV